MHSKQTNKELLHQQWEKKKIGKIHNFVSLLHLHVGK